MAHTPELPPPAAIVQLSAGRWVSHLIGIAAELGLADLVQSGPKTAEQLAGERGLSASALYRMLRALASLGIFVEQAEGRFAQTPLSDALRSDVPYSVCGMARMLNRPWSIAAWSELGHSIATDQSAFETAHGQALFEHLAQRPEEHAIFASAMSAFTAQTAGALAASYDFSDVRLLADIGGSHGTLLAMLLPKYPKLHALLFDLPNVVSGAVSVLQRHGVAERVELTAGDFFERVPSGADAYLLKHILHDWSDADCLRILKTVHAAAPAGARLLVVEAVIGAANEPQFAKLLDLEMLVMTRGGRERGLEEWQTLLAAAGFEFRRVVTTPSAVCVIEALRR